MELNITFAEQGDCVADTAYVDFEGFTLLHDYIIQQTEMVHKCKLASGSVRVLQERHYFGAPLDVLGTIDKADSGISFKSAEDEGTNTSMLIST